MLAASFGLIRRVPHWIVASSNLWSLPTTQYDKPESEFLILQWNYLQFVCLRFTSHWVHQGLQPFCINLMMNNQGIHTPTARVKGVNVFGQRLAPLSSCRPATVHSNKTPCIPRGGRYKYLSSSSCGVPKMLVSVQHVATALRVSAIPQSMPCYTRCCKVVSLYWDLFEATPTARWACQCGCNAHLANGWLWSDANAATKRDQGWRNKVR